MRANASIVDFGEPSRQFLITSVMDSSELIITRALVRLSWTRHFPLIMTLSNQWP